MKSNVVVTLAFLLTIGAANAASEATAPGIVGTWAGLDEAGMCGVFQFEEGGVVSLLVIQSKVLVPDPQGRAELHYELDTAHDPWQLDLVQVELGGVERARLKAIVRLTEGNGMELRTHFSDVRPESFPDGGDTETLVLQRTERIPVSGSAARGGAPLDLAARAACGTIGSTSEP